MDTNRLIDFYFSMGLTYEEIIKQRDINDAVLFGILVAFAPPGMMGNRANLAFCIVYINRLLLI